MAEQLRTRLERFAQRQDRVCAVVCQVYVPHTLLQGLQVPEGGPDQWAPLVARLATRPPPGPLLPLAELAAMCVDLYARCVASQVLAGPGALSRQESVFACLLRQLDSQGGDALWDVSNDPAKQGGTCDKPS